MLLVPFLGRVPEERSGNIPRTLGFHPRLGVSPRTLVFVELGAGSRPGEGPPPFANEPTDGHAVTDFWDAPDGCLCSG